MAKQGSVAPKERINIVYRSKVDGQPEVELPFKMLVMQDLTGRPKDAELEDREPVKIDRETFDAVMSSFNLGVDVRVKDRLSGAENSTIPMSLKFSTLRDFTPDGIATQVPELKRLLELRDALADELDAAGKRGWADEEFAAIVATSPPTPRVDPWRRISGLHRIRNRRQLAVVRALWERRDEVARRRDIAPGRVLPDAAIIAAAIAAPRTAAQLTALPVWGGRSLRRQVGTWLPSVQRALELPDTQLPDLKTPAEGPPPARSWAERDPAAAARLTAARAAVAAIADEHGLPVENLLSPDAVRRLCWAPPSPSPAAETVAAVLRAHGAREWQVGLTASALAGALRRAAHPPSD